MWVQFVLPAHKDMDENHTKDKGNNRPDSRADVASVITIVVMHNGASLKMSYLGRGLAS